MEEEPKGFIAEIESKNMWLGSEIEIASTSHMPSISFKPFLFSSL